MVARQVKRRSVGIDRSSYRPAYAQLVTALRDKIASGHYRPGDRLPSESELCSEFSVSPMTVRRAINMLIDQGAVIAEQGRGTFVRGLELGVATFDLRDLWRLVEDEGVEARIIEARVVKADARVAGKLDIREGSRAVAVKRLLIEEQVPVVYHAEYLVCDPRRPVVEMELGVTALRDLFDGGRNSELAYGELAVHASVLSEAEARHLKQKPGDTCFAIEHLFYDFDQKPVSWGRFVWGSDRLHFTTTVGLKPPPPQETRIVE